MRQNRVAGMVTACSFFACVQGGIAMAEKAPPNIILILTDDQGWSEMSGLMDPQVPAAASEYLSTPNMERLTKEGMRFSSGYSPAPVCTPTRRSILCGTTAPRSGTEFKSETGWIPNDHITIPRALKMANPNYACAHFGKWGGRHMVSTPEQCGYDASNGITDNPDGGMPETLGYKNHNDAPDNFIDNDDPKRTFSITKDSISFIKEQVKAGRPFYVQASYYAAHLSIVCKEATLVKYLEKGTPDRGYSPAFAAMVEDLDTGIGQLLDALDEMGLSDNTYVFFTADNGGRKDMPGGDTKRLPPNYPLTGSKHELYEGGIRVPFMVRGPGIAPQSVCRTPVAGYDLLPTFFDLAGGRSALPDYVDGGSIKPLLTNPNDVCVARPEKALFFHNPSKSYSAARQGNYKLILFWNSLGAVRGRVLYELDSDPRETDARNISAENPAKADELQALLIDYLKAVGAYYEPPAAPIKTLAGSQVIYSNEFDGGIAGGDPVRSASVSYGLESRVKDVELNGKGALVASAPTAGSQFLVKLNDQPLLKSPVRLTAKVKAPTGRWWIGVGFLEKSAGKLNDAVANTGPWIQVGPSSLTVRGGSATAGSTFNLRDSHAAGDLLELVMTYYPNQTVDLALNGTTITNGLPMAHEINGAKSDPKIQCLQVQFFQIPPEDGAYVDSVKVETIVD